MKTTTMHEARAEFSKLVDRALKGEPQRVTRRGKEAVVIVSEEAWQKRQPKADAPATATLADLLLKYAGEEGYDDVIGSERPWKERTLGDLLADFAEKVGFRDEDFDRSWAEKGPR